MNVPDAKCALESVPKWLGTLSEWLAPIPLKKPTVYPSNNQIQKIKNFIIDPLIIGINIERSNSDQLIMLRIKKMLENGWINEVKSLLDSGIKIDSAPMRSIGYREVAEYIKNNLSKDELEEKIYTSTRKLMRHQDNWFKKSDKRIKWINFSNSFSEADIIIKEWLEN